MTEQEYLQIKKHLLSLFLNQDQVDLNKEKRVKELCLLPIKMKF